MMIVIHMLQLVNAVPTQLGCRTIVRQVVAGANHPQVCIYLYLYIQTTHLIVS